MMRSLFSGVSGLKIHQSKMDVIGNNIANVNTVGFKANTVTFADVFYQTTQKAAGANVGSFVLIICVTFFSPVCGWVWGTISSYTILMRNLDKYVHLKHGNGMGRLMKARLR
jgi:hypothetical protein